MSDRYPSNIEKLAAFQESNLPFPAKQTCYHQRKKLVWTEYGNDLQKFAYRQLRHQCQDCGRMLPQQLPHSNARPDTPDVDLDFLRRGIQQESEAWQRWRDQRQQQMWERENERRQQYQEYLKTPQWFAKRAKVLERAKGICEGCQENRATQVHHLTYQHLGNELLWELRAVCRECHERAHDIR